MDNYLVTVVFDVDADSPEEAARTAKALAQSDPDFWPSSATARGTVGALAEIDLEDAGRRSCSCGEAWADEPGHDNEQAV